MEAGRKDKLLSPRNAGQVLLALLFVATISGAIAIILRQASLGSVELLVATTTPAPELKVYISGAVARPGVYQMQEGDRLEQALDTAGGPLPEADLNRINLAQRLNDQDHFYIPRLGEIAGPPLATSPSPQRDLLDINSASLEELVSLPNIGEIRAKAIISYRETNGPFRTVEELLKVPGIGPSILSSIRNLIRVD